MSQVSKQVCWTLQGQVAAAQRGSVRAHGPGPRLGRRVWGCGVGLVRLHDQGRHVVRVFDAEGDDGSAGLGHRHLGEKRL